MVAGSVVVDANILIALCAKEAKLATAENALEVYAISGWEFYAPAVLIAEVLYVLCQKHKSNDLSDVDYSVAIDNFQDQIKAIAIADDSSLIERAVEIQQGYGCSRTSDSIYIALAEHLGQTGSVEILTFDDGFVNQSGKNAPTVTVNLLPN